MNDGRAPWLRPVIALFGGAVFFMPLYLVLVNVFKHGADIVPDPAGPPSPPTTDNIAAVLSRPDNLFVYGLVNSVAVTAISITILAVLSAMLGHYIARSRHLLAKVVMVTPLCGPLIPSPVILAPITMVLRALDLARHPAGRREPGGRPHRLGRGGDDGLRPAARPDRPRRDGRRGRRPEPGGPGTGRPRAGGRPERRLSRHALRRACGVVEAVLAQVVRRPQRRRAGEVLLRVAVPDRLLQPRGQDGPRPLRRLGHHRLAPVQR
ncbi:hypothetical protein [Streptosporangium vulgare]|uniref:hypothetical protein n=1 Tax=Streptosporangium vulgare TaxID=46190 RepID=UPI003CD09E72